MWLFDRIYLNHVVLGTTMIRSPGEGCWLGLGHWGHPDVM